MAYDKNSHFFKINVQSIWEAVKLSPEKPSCFALKRSGAIFTIPSSPRYWVDRKISKGFKIYQRGFARTNFGLPIPIVNRNQTEHVHMRI